MGLGLGIGFDVAASVFADEAAPVLLSAEVGSVAADLLVIRLNEVIDSGSVPDTSDFSVNDGADNPVTNVAILENTIRLTLTNEVEEGDSVVVSYTAGLNSIQDQAGNDLADFTDQAVTNNLSSATYMTDKEGQNVPDKQDNNIEIKE